jgi:alkylated DNA repair dioxygenase AlkB
VFDESYADNAFHEINNEITWNEMLHKGGAVPRLISIQGDVWKNAFPLYRHPADEQPQLVPWTTTVRECRNKTVDIVNQPLNHALIQLYRNGKDNISEHADKSLDILRGTSIINVSFGASRVMILKTKADYNGNKIAQKITIPHNSIFVLGWKTNLEFTHSIKQDKRVSVLKRADELLYDEQRISLTFRQIATWLVKLSCNNINDILCLSSDTMEHKGEHCEVVHSIDASSGDNIVNSTTVNLVLGQGSSRKLLEVPSIDTLDSTSVIDSSHDIYECYNRNTLETLLFQYDSIVKEFTMSGRIDSMVNDAVDQSNKLLIAFSAENKSCFFDWGQYYECGYDIVNFKFVE